MSIEYTKRGSILWSSAYLLYIKSCLFLLYLYSLNIYTCIHWHFIGFVYFNCVQVIKHPLYLVIYIYSVPTYIYIICLNVERNELDATFFIVYTIFSLKPFKPEIMIHFICYFVSFACIMYNEPLICAYCDF